MLVGIYILQWKYFKTMALKDWNCFATYPLTLGSGAPGLPSFSVKPTFLLRYVFRIIRKQRLENTCVWTIAATETMMAMLDTRMSKAPTMMAADLKLVQPQHLFLSSGGIIAPSISLNKQRFRWKVCWAQQQQLRRRESAFLENGKAAHSFGGKVSQRSALGLDSFAGLDLFCLSMQWRVSTITITTENIKTHFKDKYHHENVI